MTPGISADLKHLTFAEFLTCTAEGDTVYELVAGDLVAMPTESPENNQIARGLFLELARLLPLALLGYKDTEVEVTGRQATCRVPDLLVHSQESAASLAGASRSTLTRDMPPPALVIEIVSPGVSNRARDYRYKHTEYAARGIAEYWIVDPEEQQITLCEWVEGQYEDQVLRGDAPITSSIVPALQLTVAQVFAFAHSIH